MGCIHILHGVRRIMGIFNGVKWGVVGDSLSTNLSTTRGNYPFVIIDAGTGVNIKNVAISGTGYYDDVPFYTHAESLDIDTDVITIFGSTNDRSFQGSSVGDRRYHYAEHQTMNSSHLVTGMTAPENDGFDDSGNYTGESTLAAYVNRAIDAYHKRCPNAKIIVVPPICSTYNSNGNNTDPGTYNAAITVLKCTEGWIANKNASSWLSLMNLWVSDFNTFVSDTTIKDVWLASNLGGTLDFRKKSPVILVGNDWTAEQASDFAAEYWGHAGGDSLSQVHANKTYNQRYLAPKFANAICGVLGIDPNGLPEALKLNNVAPPTKVLAYDIDGRAITQIKNINGDPMTDLYSIIGQPLVG